VHKKQINLDHRGNDFLYAFLTFGLLHCSRRCLVLNSFEAIEEALVKNGTCYADRPGLFLDWFNGNKRNKGLKL